MSDAVKIYKEDGIGFLALNRPDKLNALNKDIFDGIAKGVKEFDKDNDVSVVVIYGEGRAFCAGLDFKDFLGRFRPENFKSTEDLYNAVYEYVVFMQDSFSVIENSKKVYIAAINGFCVGGGLDLAATCDIRVASRDAVFSIMETQVGVIDDLGALQRLPRIIGEGHTKYLAFTSDKISSNEAYRMGLVEKITETKKELLLLAKKIAKNISSKRKKAVFGTKIALHHLREHTVAESLLFTAKSNADLFDPQLLMENFLKNIGKK
ncbi:enoyl-CoA hydratase/isomerase family protein [Hippea jasoniae]|uniref:enoyl-CoA hydratase/isomerase family protein n=1 Tax=Hippea jasoniae TaxID=944479 RepID=UPI000555DF42|nr:enoyl-CoA hydratase-related protein [Hippea jasoniae]